ncbi:MAG TPA: DUF6798 domain-containing protein, partial [Bryobacteraceae bacterium]|nr:DUF6798 domain-containing protein [Bryobacteraceae bacterium]
MKPGLVFAAISVLTVLTFVQFPGHTWIQQDTQIYAPILEHLRDPSVLSKDMLVQRPHVTFTLYDEMAVALCRATGLEFREVLGGIQLLTRGLGIWGVYLMAAAMGLTEIPALLVAAIFSLGAMIMGPAVMTFELEPNPRGFAVPLLLLGVGLISHARYLAAGIAGAAAFLLHAPTVYPFWGVYFCLALYPSKPQQMRRRLYAFAPLLVAALILLFASRHQAGVGEAQLFLARLDATQEAFQRWRAAYVWISIWWRDWTPQYLFLAATALVAYLRVRRDTPLDLRFFLLGMPLVGLLSIPVSYILLERMKWALVPQFQPLRALLFVTFAAVFLASVAGYRAIGARRWPEAFLWFVLAYVIPVNTAVLAIPAANRVLVLVLLAAGACLACRAAEEKRWALPVAALVAVGAFFLIPTVGKVVSYPKLHTPELAQLSEWAKARTPADAVFLFPHAGRDLSAGVFRSEALRAIYVDWKGGGQVNYLRALGEEWGRRWEQTMTKPFRAEDVARFRQ